MKYYAQIYQGLVTGINVFPDDADLPANHVDVTDMDPRPGRWWFYNENTDVFSAPTPPATPVKTITGFDLFNSFTASEWEGFETYDGTYVGQVKRFMRLCAMYQDIEIKINNSQLVSMVNGLETINLIGSGRAAEILS